jgi:hypothetical protein
MHREDLYLHKDLHPGGFAVSCGRVECRSDVEFGV